MVKVGRQGAHQRWDVVIASIHIQRRAEALSVFDIYINESNDLLAIDRQKRLEPINPARVRLHLAMTNPNDNRDTSDVDLALYEAGTVHNVGV